MPLESIAEGILGSVLRVLLWVIVEIIFELLIKGLGYIVCRPFTKSDVDDPLCAVVGVLAWLLIVLALIKIFVL